MDTRTVVMIPALIIALMVGAALYALAVLPPDSLMPTHFNFAGKPDAFARPLVALSILPAVAIAALLITVLVSLTARGGLAHSEAAFRGSIVAPFAILAITHGLQIAYALGFDVNVTRIITQATGVMFVVLGNVLGKIRRNHWFGVRTPWTLRDDWVWDRTHRFSGWVFVGAGAALTIAAAVMPAGPVLSSVLILAIAVIVILPTAKSYLLWRERRGV